MAATRISTAISSSIELDRALDLDRKVDLADRPLDLRGQHFSTLEPSAAHSEAHCVLDLPLRGDAHLLEEFSHAHVQRVLVHDALLMVSWSLHALYRFEGAPPYLRDS